METDELELLLGEAGPEDKEEDEEASGDEGGEGGEPLRKRAKRAERKTRQDRNRAARRKGAEVALAAAKRGRALRRGLSNLGVLRSELEEAEAQQAARAIRKRVRKNPSCLGRRVGAPDAEAAGLCPSLLAAAALLTSSPASLCSASSLAP